MKNFFFFLMIFSVVTIVACEEEDTYVENDPYLKAVFYNMDSLEKDGGVYDTLSILSDKLDCLSDTLEYFTNYSNYLTDSLLNLEDSLNNGGDEKIQEIYNDFLEEQQVTQNLYEEFSDLDSIMSASNDYWSEVSATILSGEVKILSITNRNNGKIVDDYEDSSSVWNLPLDMNADVSKLLIKLGSEEHSEFDIEFNLDIVYQRLITSDEFGNVVVEPYGFDEGGIVFSNPPVDRIELNCKSSECLESETSINIYF